jgi:3-oxoacyl-[acyl-carrier protein] reductase
MFSDTSLKDRTVLITGGGRGFGWLIAEALLKQGAKVFLTASRHPEQLVEVQAKAAELAPAAHCATMVADVCNWADCQATVAAALEAFGHIDVLMNNAGRGTSEYRMSRSDPVPFYQIPVEAWRTVIDTNLNGSYQMARAMVPHMLERRFGKIINFSTSLTTMVGLGLSAYGASKSGLETATVVWAKELAGSGVDVNVLLPGGASDTDFITQSMVPGPVGQRGGPLLPADVIVPPALWLAADRSNGVTGRRIIGKFWDHNQDPDEAIKACLEDQHDTPRIM